MSPTPLFDRVLVKAVDEERRVWTPSTAATPRRGVILEVGKDAAELEPGDEVLFLPTKAYEFTVADERMYVTREVEILVLLDRAATPTLRP